MRTRLLATILILLAAFLDEAACGPAAADPAEGLAGQQPAAPAVAGPAKTDDVRVARLIENLASPSYATRQHADADLSQLGAAGRQQLLEGARSGDPEVRLRCLRLLKRLDIEDLWRGSRITLVNPKIQISEAVRQLAAQSGNGLTAGDQYGSFEEATVRLDLRDATFWQALDALCAQSDNRVRLRYGSEHPGWVLVSGEPGRYPVAYAGPIRGQITDARRVFVEEFNYKNLDSETTHTFQWNVLITWEDRFRIVAHNCQLDVTDAVADVPARILTVGQAESGWQVVESSSRQFSTALRIHPPPQAARQLDRLTLEWQVIAVGGMTPLELSPIDSGTVARQDDVIAEIEDVEKTSANRWEIVVSVARDLVVPEPEEILYIENEFELLDADGKPFSQHGARRLSVAGGKARQKLTFLAPTNDSTPQQLILRYPRIRDRRTLSIPFENVPLPVARPE